MTPEKLIKKYATILLRDAARLTLDEQVKLFGLLTAYASARANLALSMRNLLRRGAYVCHRLGR